MDCVVFFDHVTVPWENVFLCGDVNRCNAMYEATNAVVHMMHQVVVKNVVKSEFLLGLAARIAEAGDAMSLPHVRERLAEMIMTTETMRACLRAAEADAACETGHIRAGAGPARYGAQSVSPALSADGRDNPAQQLLEPDGDAVGA